MPLEDLNRDLYGNKNEELGQRMHVPQEFVPSGNRTSEESPFQGEQKWGKADKGMTPTQKKVMWSIAGVFIAVAIIIGGFEGYQWYKKNAFHQDRVTVSFEGPTRADSLQDEQYQIHYTNNNSATLKNVTIKLDYSENFQPTNNSNVNLKKLSTMSSTIFVGDIKPHADATVALNGIFYAPKDSLVYLNATLQYVSSTGSEPLETKNQMAVSISSSPIQLEVSVPQTVTDGNQVEYVISYKNLNIQSLDGARLQVDYPDGFEFSDATTAPSERQSVWNLGSIAPGEGGEMKIHGNIHGGNDETKTITVSLGHMSSDGQFALYNQRKETSKMVASVLSLSQSVDGIKNGVVNPGDTLKFIIAYKNTGDLGLRNTIITERLAGVVLDFAQLKMDQGAFDSTTGTITWKASDIPQLANIPPQGSGQVIFTVPVKNIIPIVDTASKNFTVDSVASIDSPDIPTPIGSNKIVSSNTVSLKVSSKVIFNSSGFFYDAAIANSGPLPMEVGKETTFTLHWDVSNVSNDLSGTRVSAALPTGARWIGKTSPDSENMTYDSRTNQVTWTVGKVVAGAGITSPKREVAFQVGVTPQPSQSGAFLTLIGASTLEAHDDFTGMAVASTSSPIDTQLRWDTKMSSQQYQVQ